jgi:hypothetical protein
MECALDAHCHPQVRRPHLGRHSRRSFQSVLVMQPAQNAGGPDMVCWKMMAMTPFVDPLRKWIRNA